MKRLLFLSVLVFAQGLSLVAKGQNRFEDSLYRLARTTKDDSLRLYYLFEYGRTVGGHDRKRGLAIHDSLKKEAARVNMPYFIGNAALDQSAICFFNGDYIQSILYDEESLTHFEKLPEGKVKTRSIAASLVNLGGTYSLINDLSSAQQYYSRGIDSLILLNDQDALITSYFNMAFLYIDIQEWDMALQYLRKSIKAGFLANNPRELLNSASRAAAIDFKKGYFQEGRRMLAICDSLYPLTSDLIASIYYDYAKAEGFRYMGNPSAALQLHKKALQTSYIHNDPYYIVDESAAIGQLFLTLNQIDSAQAYLTNATSYCRKYGYLPKLKTLLADWASYFERAGDFTNAYKFKKQEQFFTDSLIQVQNHNRILLYDARYQSRQKEERISQLQSESNQQQKLLKQQSTINLLLGLVALIFAILILLGYTSFRQKQKIQQQKLAELETEKQLLTTEALLKGEEKERTRLAKDLHDGLGGMLSGIQHLFRNIKGNLVITPEAQQSFDRGLDMLDQSIHEMRRVAHNMMPESLVKFGLDIALRDFISDINSAGSLNVSYQSVGIDHIALPPTTNITVYRIIQELLNNTLKHAGATNALVQLYLIENQLSITVEDDGKGMDTDSEQLKQGMGWTNIRNRVQFLQGTLDLKSAPGNGTSVLILLPV
jgi:two-component system, NarL family, sensor kinase